jgi:methylated-DNA-[protein]-cysteine S-methyltransferase
MKLHLGKIPSPLGEIWLVTDDQEQVCALDYADHQAHLRRGLCEHYGAYELIDAPAPARIVTALNSYFDGNLAALDDIAAVTTGSELQRQVWKALDHIPAGKTTSYGELARALGYEDPRAAIEVGMALHANPVAIIVPCHRVIAKNGDLKGYAGGLHRKRWLLEHEGALAKADESRLPGI